MNLKKISAVLAASLMMCAAITSCGDKKKSEKKSSYVNKSAADVTAAQESSAVAVEAGQAYLEIRDSKGNNQYLGTVKENLCYNAVVADITANGSYSVSVTADTDGFRASAGTNTKPEGILYAALKIKDGAASCPAAVLTIDSIEVDGTSIPLAAKNYTFTESGKDIKSNIYNEWATIVPDGSVSAEGAVTNDTPGYSSVLVSKDAFASWTKVTVNFTVSGL
ncbi:MAG: hypothetical protein IKK91_01100 [Ruminococcus sp.]|nr:hypothetical protein [Ruminococcus sp.]